MGPFAETKEPILSPTLHGEVSDVETEDEDGEDAEGGLNGGQLNDLTQPSTSSATESGEVKALRRALARAQEQIRELEELVHR